MPQAPTIKVFVPAPLRECCEGAAELSLAASSVRATLETIAQRYPALYRGICEETGRVRRHVNLFVNTDHIRDRAGLDTSLASGDVLTILPAVSGGATAHEVISKEGTTDEHG